MSTNLPLATRARPLESAFGGLDKLFTSHRLNGLCAAALLSTRFLVMLHATRTDGHLLMADLRIDRPRDLSVFLCGQKAMRGAFVGQLLVMGVRRSRIHSEEFSLR